MFYVTKQKVNSSELRNRLNFEPDLVQARIMYGDRIMWVGESFIEEEKQLDGIVKQELAKLGVSKQELARLA